MQQPTQTESEATNLVALTDELIPVPKPRSALEITSFSSKIVFESQRILSKVSGMDPKSNFRLVLVRHVKDLGGIPRSQIDEVLTDLVKIDGQACDGISCARILGIDQGEVNDFLDSTYRRLAEDKNLSKPENITLRHLFLGSFKRGPGETVPPRKSLAVRVLYKVAKFVGESGVMLSDPNYRFMVELYPGDLKKAHRLTCSKDSCEAEVLKPIRLNMNLPVFLNAHILVRYRVGTEHLTGAIRHQAMIGGRVTPISVGEILSFSIDFWAEVESSVKTAYKPVIKNFDCSATATCNLPWISVGAIFDRKGIEFDHYLTASEKLGKFVEATPALPPKTIRVEYKDLPEKIREIKKAVDDGTLGEAPNLNPDILWTEFTGPRQRG